MEALYICIYSEELKDWSDVFYRLYFEEKKTLDTLISIRIFDIAGLVLDTKASKLTKVKIRKTTLFFSGCNFLKYFFPKVYTDLGAGI